jgi:hypothetical protein
MSNADMRPCAVGDILWQSEVPCGADAVIRVAAPPKHPSSGTAVVDAVALCATVSVPWVNCYIPSCMVSDSQVFGDVMHAKWGYDDGVKYRTRKQHRSGPAIAPLVAELIVISTEALATIQAIVDRHDASVALMEAERAAAYAAWPVRF